jgi:hypothetical protein
MKEGVMGRTVELIDGIQKRLDDIETEATRLLVFANITFDSALGSRLKKIAKVIFRNATEIEEIEISSRTFSARRGVVRRSSFLEESSFSRLLEVDFPFRLWRLHSMAMANPASDS